MKVVAVVVVVAALAVVVVVAGVGGTVATSFAQRPVVGNGARPRPTPQRLLPWPPRRPAHSDWPAAARSHVPARRAQQCDRRT